MPARQDALAAEDDQRRAGGSGSGSRRHLGQLVPGRGGQDQHRRSARSASSRGRRSAIAAQLLRREHQRAAERQQAEDLADRDVEAEGGELQRPGRSGDRRQVPSRSAQQVDHARGGGPARPWAGRSSPRCRSRRPGCRARRPRRPVRSAPQPARAELVQADDAAHAGAAAGRAARSWVSSTGAPASSSMKRQALPRVAGIERQVGAAGLEDAEQRRPPSPSERSRQSPTTHLRADARARAGGAPAGWPARRARRSVRLLVLADHGHRVRRPRRLRLEQLVQAGCRADRPPRCRSTPPGAGCRSAAVSSGSSESRCSGVGHDRRPAAARSAPSSRSIGRARRTGRWRTPTRPADLAVPLVEASVRSNFAVVPARADRPQAQARDLQRSRPARSAARTSPGTAASWARLRSGASSSTSFSNGRSWCA